MFIQFSTQMEARLNVLCTWTYLSRRRLFTRPLSIHYRKNTAIKQKNSKTASNGRGFNTIGAICSSRAMSRGE